VVAVEMPVEALVVYISKKAFGAQSLRQCSHSQRLFVQTRRVPLVSGEGEAEEVLTASLVQTYYEKMVEEGVAVVLVVVEGGGSGYLVTG
jgi:hypothetical protein